MTDDERVQQAGLVGLAQLSLDDLNSLDDTALGHALRRVLADAVTAEDAVSAFHAFIGE